MTKKIEDVKQHRWLPDPHKRHGVVESKKVYKRKKKVKTDEQD